MLIDTHVHLQDRQFRHDLDFVLARALDAGITRMVCIADDLPAARQAAMLARRYPQLSATVGVHPHHERTYDDRVESEIRSMAASGKFVAIGEVGLDYHYPDFRKEKQNEVFSRQAQIATANNLPLVIHCRDAYSDLIALFRNRSDITSRGVVHCFSGTEEDARQLTELGFYLGIGGSATYPKAEELRRAIVAVGLDKIVLETDAPYLAPQSRRGRRNEPSFMLLTALEIAQLFGVSFHEVARTTMANAMKLYSFSSVHPTSGNTHDNESKVIHLQAGQDWSVILEEAQRIKSTSGRVELEIDAKDIPTLSPHTYHDAAGWIDQIVLHLDDAPSDTLAPALQNRIAEFRKSIPEIILRVTPTPTTDIAEIRSLAVETLRIRMQIQNGIQNPDAN